MYHCYSAAWKIHIPQCSSEGFNLTVSLQHTNTQPSLLRGAITKSECVRGGWHSNHLSHSPSASFLSSSITPLHRRDARRMMGGFVPQRYFLRLWDGGENHTNNRISVTVWDFGGKWSNSSATEIHFCVTQKDFSNLLLVFFRKAESPALRPCSFSGFERHVYLIYCAVTRNRTTTALWILFLHGCSRRSKYFNCKKKKNCISQN